MFTTLQENVHARNKAFAHLNFMCKTLLILAIIVQKLNLETFISNYIINETQNTFFHSRCIDRSEFLCFGVDFVDNRPGKVLRTGLLVQEVGDESRWRLTTSMLETLASVTLARATTQWIGFKVGLPDPRRNRSGCKVWIIFGAVAHQMRKSQLPGLIK